MELTPEEVIQKAAAIEEMMTSEGWKLLMDVVSGLLSSELKALMGTPLNEAYYRKVGMIQSIHFISELQALIKDNETRDFLLHQGRANGLSILEKTPKMFFEGRQKAQQVLHKQFGQNNIDLEKEKKEFFKDTYKES